MVYDTIFVVGRGMGVNQVRSGSGQMEQWGGWVVNYMVLYGMRARAKKQLRSKTEAAKSLLQHIEPVVLVKGCDHP